MSFNSKAYLAYEERRLEPEQVKGTQRRYKEVKPVTPILKPYPVVSEYEQNRGEDEYLKSKGII